MTNSPEPPLRIRDAARAVVLDPDDRVLLVRFEFPITGTRWALPGGGVDPGEDHVTALRRELVEEVGLHDVEIGPHIWDRLHIVPFISGHWDGQREQIHLVRTDRFAPAPTLTAAELEAEYVFGLRWWTLDEIASSEEVFAPRALAARLAELLTHGPPETPLDVGV